MSFDERTYMQVAAICIGQCFCLKPRVAVVWNPKPVLCDLPVLPAGCCVPLMLPLPLPAAFSRHFQGAGICWEVPDSFLQTGSYLQNAH